MSHVVGIDLGTTNSLVAYVKRPPEDGLQDQVVPEVIRDQSGDALLPSVVSVGEDGTLFVGREARSRDQPPQGEPNRQRDRDRPENPPSSVRRGGAVGR